MDTFEALVSLDSRREPDRARTAFYITDEVLHKCDPGFIAGMFGSVLLDHFRGRSIEDLLTTLSRDQLLELSQCVVNELDRRET